MEGGQRMSKIDHERLNTALKKIFPEKAIGPKFVEFPSEINTLMQFEVERQKYMIKIQTLPAVSKWENFRLEKEGKLLKFFTDQKQSNILNVPVPELVYIENDENLLGFRFIVYKFVEGEILYHIWEKLSRDQKYDICIQLGQIMRDIHKVKYDFFGEIEDCGNVTRYPDYKGFLLGILTELVANLRKLAYLPEEILEKSNGFILENINKMNPVLEASLIHCDLHHANIVVNDDGDGEYKISAILDWEWAAADSPLVDLFYTQETMLRDLYLREAFFTEYFGEHRTELNEFNIDKTLLDLIQILDVTAHEWSIREPNSNEITSAETKINSSLSQIP